MGLDGGWDDAMIDMQRATQPEIVDCARHVGKMTQFGSPIPICGMAGDRQAASVGQACPTPGDTEATFGTRAFVLTQAGPTPPCSGHRLLSTATWQRDGERGCALEGVVD